MMDRARRRCVKQQLWEQQNGRYAYCGMKKRIGLMTVDHIIPLSRGGTDSVYNLQCTFKKCNGLKDDMLPNEFTALARRILDNSIEIEKRLQKGGAV